MNGNTHILNSEQNAECLMKKDSQVCFPSKIWLLHLFHKNIACLICCWADKKHTENHILEYFLHAWNDFYFTEWRWGALIVSWHRKINTHTYTASIQCHSIVSFPIWKVSKRNRPLMPCIIFPEKTNMFGNMKTRSRNTSLHSFTTCFNCVSTCDISSFFSTVFLNQWEDFF